MQTVRIPFRRDAFEAAAPGALVALLRETWPTEEFADRGDHVAVYADGDLVGAAFFKF